MIIAVCDTVGGTPCVVFYRHGLPVMTLWGAFTSPTKALPDSAIEDIKGLIETTKSLKMSNAETQAAVNLYLKENGCT